MKITHYILITAASLLLLPGCLKESGPTDADLITIEASIGPQTKVNYEGNGSTFVDGDKIAVYAWTGSASPVPEARAVDGVVNTLGDTGWSPATLMRWKSMSDTHYFLGVSPVHSISNFTEDPFTLVPDNYTASDLLVATTPAGIAPTKNPISLEFSHLMAKLVVNLTFRSQWSSAPTVTSVTVGAKKTGTVNYLAKEVTATGTVEAVALSATDNASWSGLQIPQTGVTTITVRIGDTDYVYTHSTDIPLAGGQYTTINLNVGRDKLELDQTGISITNWESGTPIGGETAQPGGPFALDAYFPADQLPGSSFWQNKDVILVLCKVEGKSFVSNTYAKSLKMTHNGTAWTVAEMLNGTASPGCLGLEEGDQVTMRAVYLPNDNPTVVPDGKGGYAFLGLISGEADNSSNCYLTATLSATVSGGRLSGCFDLSLPDRVMLFKIAYSSGYSVSTRFLREPHLTPLGLKGFTADLDAVNADPVHGAPLKRLYGRFSGDSSAPNVFCAELDEGLDNVWTDYHFTRVTNDGAFAGYGKRLAMSGASGRVLELPALASSDWQALTYTPVDLGIDIDDPVRGGKKRVYWASCNVGATKPEEYGDYFAWGETATKTNYAWSTLQYCTDDEGKKFSKYVPSNQASYWSGAGSPDNRTVLDAEDDAATANWGAPWRTPTDAEWTELRTKCTWTWTTQNGEKGYLVSNNGNSLFLPAAGFLYESNVSEAGSLGCYWSSSLYTNPYDALYMDFDSGRVGRSGNSRYCGQSVRPVSE